ncbi:MAG: MaoC/PaaZ C-terminal domain-containing protein [Solirubrobacteraceae bacterium]
MSGTAVAGWNLGKLGEWTDPHPFEVTRERIVAYAAATNDEHPAHRSGDLAPPVFAIVPAFEICAQPTMAIVPGEVIMRVVHGEQDFRLHRPIVPGDRLVTRAAGVGVHGRSSGVVLVVKAQTTTEAGEPVVDAYMTSFFRGASLDVHEGEEPPAHDAPRGAELGSVLHAYDDDQTQRYSKASGDPMPIHLDEEFAKAMGLPGIIVHGLCTMAFCSRAVIQTCCPDDPARLKRLAVRFAKIVQPSETVTTTLSDGGEGRVAFETVSSNGNVAIKDGLAELRRPEVRT